ncbi:MAG: hypothetical protein ACFCUE_04605 [Candidatus Bathyarchaeia archaeon]
MQPHKPSKLELYLEILRTIETKKPTKIETIRRHLNIDQNFLNHAITFLEKLNLITKRTTNNQLNIKSTLRGQRISRYFMELSHGSFFCILPTDATCRNER